MNTKNNQRSRMTRRLLCDAYLQLLHNCPNNKITVKAICQQADVNRSTFYIYYNEPDDILREIESTTISATHQYLSQIKDQRKDPLNAKESLLELLNYIEKNQLLFSSLLIENKDPSFSSSFAKISLEIIEESFPVILQKEEYKSVYHFISSGSFAIISDWLENECNYSKMQICNTIYTLSKGCLDSISVDMSAK